MKYINVYHWNSNIHGIGVFSKEDFNAALDEKHAEAIASNLSRAEFYTTAINQHYKMLVRAKAQGEADKKFLQGWQVDLEKLIKN